MKSAILMSVAASAVLFAMPLLTQAADLSLSDCKIHQQFSTTVPESCKQLLANQPKLKTRGVQSQSNSIGHSNQAGTVPRSMGMVVRGISITERGVASLGEIKFSKNSAALTDKSKSTLNLLGKIMSDPVNADSRFRLEGHTDASGSDAHNKSLSLRRALSVQKYLSGAFQITANRFDVIGQGESKLKFPKDPESARNRRVEVVNLGIKK